MKTITIPTDQYKCLREHLKKANEIFKSLGMDGSLTRERLAPTPTPKETRPQKINRYIKLIESGARCKKPNHLKS